MDRIRVPFGILGRTGPEMRHIVGFGDRSTGWDTFGGEFGARHITNGTYFRSDAALFPNYFGHTCLLLVQIEGPKSPFSTTLQLNGNFNGLYLRSETRHRPRQSGKFVDNYKGSPTLSPNDINFGPQTASNWTCIFTNPTLILHSISLPVFAAGDRMPRIKNSRLDRYGTEHFEQQQFGPAGVEGVIVRYCQSNNVGSSIFVQGFRHARSQPTLLRNSRISGPKPAHPFGATVSSPPFPNFLFLPSLPFSYLLLPLTSENWPSSPARRFGSTMSFFLWVPVARFSFCGNQNAHLNQRASV